MRSSQRPGATLKEESDALFVDADVSDGAGMVTNRLRGTMDRPARAASGQAATLARTRDEAASVRLSTLFG